MIIFDRLLIGGIRFVLDQLVNAAETQLNNDGALKEHLIAAQMRHELGELSDEEFSALEAGILQRLREIRERQMQGAPKMGDARVTGVEIDFGGEDKEGR